MVTYQGFDFRLEVKSLQTNSIKMLNPANSQLVPKVIQEPIRRMVPAGQRQRRRWVESDEYKTIWQAGRMDGRYIGNVQCDASDKRAIELPDGSKVTTTNLRVGDFDILAMGLFAFREQWDFGFMLNRDLPRSTYKKYPPEVQSQLIKTLIPVTWPLPEHCVPDPFILLDRLVEERRRSQS